MELPEQESFFFEQETSTTGIRPARKDAIIFIAFTIIYDTQIAGGDDTL